MPLTRGGPDGPSSLKLTTAGDGNERDGVSVAIALSSREHAHRALLNHSRMCVLHALDGPIAAMPPEDSIAASSPSAPAPPVTHGAEPQALP